MVEYRLNIEVILNDDSLIAKDCPIKVPEGSDIKQIIGQVLGSISTGGLMEFDQITQTLSVVPSSRIREIRCQVPSIASPSLVV